MDFDLKKWAPWNWFKKEQDADQGAGNVPVAKTNLSTNPPSPSLDPLLQLHREVDRLFDDAFRGFRERWPRMTHGMGAFLSGWIISRFSMSASNIWIWVSALLWTLGGVLNLVSNISHPFWFAIADTCIYLPMTILGSRFSGKKV